MCHSAHHAQDYYTKQLRGIAFIEYTSPLDAEDALPNLNRMYLGGKEVQAILAQQVRGVTLCTQHLHYFMILATQFSGVGGKEVQAILAQQVRGLGRRHYRCMPLFCNFGHSVF